VRILYLTEYFQTPAEGGLMRTWEIAKYLVDHGHEVSVVVAAPHHITGEIPAAVRGRLWHRSTIEGIDVTKVWAPSTFRASYWHRLRYYLSAPTLALAASIGRRADVVIASSPPFFLGPGAYLLSRAKRVPFVLEMRDAWLEFAIASGMVPRPIVGMLTAMQRWLLRHADRVVAVTPGLYRLANSTLPRRSHGKVILVMNGYEEDVFRDVDPGLAQRICDQWRLHSRFIVIYAGTLGLARDGLTLVRAARELKDLPEVQFVFLGEGERRAEMLEYVQRHELGNCLFVPMQPRRDVPAWLAVSAVGINATRRGEAQESSLSNKIFDYLGAGIPVVFSGDGDTVDFLVRSGGGIIVPSEDAKGMAAAIRNLHDDAELRRKLGASGRAFVIENFSRSKLVAPLERMLTEIRSPAHAL